MRRMAVAVVGAVTIIAVGVPSAGGMYGGLPQNPQPGWAVRLDWAGQPNCSGTMISLRWAITAAHCFVLTSTDPTTQSADVAGQHVGIDAIYTYPGFQAFYPDIALVHLASPVSGVSTLPLGTGDDMNYFMRKGVTVFGYGWTTRSGSGTMTSIINKSPDGSWTLWGSSQNTCPNGTPSGAYCFKYTGKNSAGTIRNGDSGGPFVGWRNGGWRVLGVVSGYVSGSWQGATSPVSPGVGGWITKTLTLPEADSLSPTHGSTAGGYQVDIYGGGFDPAPTSVSFGGSTVPVTTLSSTHLVVQAPGGPANGGPVSVAVNMPGKTSNLLTFTYDTPVAPPPPPGPTLGFHIQDAFLGGTWARTDPGNGTWYSQSVRPANGAYWYPNGLGVAVDCARAAASYTVRFVDGHTETWNTWFHVTDGKWFPSAAAQETAHDGFYGLAGC